MKNITILFFLSLMISAVICGTLSSSAQQKCTNPNSYWDGDKCSCLPKYYPVRGSCQACSISTFWNGNTCVSLSILSPQTDRQQRPTPPKPKVVCNGANQIKRPDNTCGCISGFYMDNGNCVAGKECPANSVRMSPTSCLCNTGFFENQGYCTKCKRWFFFDQTTSSCKNACPAHSLYDNNLATCVCLNGYYKKSDTQCAECPAGTVWNQGACISCPVNSYLSGTTCVCYTGYAANSAGVCTITSCPGVNSYVTPGGTCGTCSPSQVGNGKICQACPAGSTFDASGKCICNFAPGTGGYFDVASWTCKSCLGSTFVFGNQCVSCPFNMQWSSIINNCVCITGYTVNNFGICAPNCPNGIIVAGSCASCPLNSIPNPTKTSCVCVAGYSFNVAGVCTQTCVPPYFFFAGKCIICPVNSVWNPITNKCVCNSGYSQNAFGLCISNCPVGSIPGNNGGCVCITGYYSQFGNNIPPCFQCSSGCTTCTSNTACSNCASGWFLNNGQCNSITCPLGHTFNPLTSKCDQICGDGKKFNLPCDDGNTANGDGCSSTCQIESGWTCSGGNPFKADTCVRQNGPGPGTLVGIVIMNNNIQIQITYSNFGNSRILFVMASTPVVRCTIALNKVTCQRNGFTGAVQVTSIIQTATGNQRVVTPVGPASAKGAKKVDARPK